MAVHRTVQRELWDLIIRKTQGQKRKDLIGWFKRDHADRSLERMIKKLETLPDLPEQ